MIKVIIDTREQAPFSFDGLDVEIINDTLTTGDYSLWGFTDRVAIERKSLGDLIGCLGTGRERFCRELERLRSFDSAVIVVESPYSDIEQGRYRSNLKPQSATQSIISIMQRYRMPFYFAPSRSNAEQFAFDFLRHYYRHAKALYSAVAKMQRHVIAENNAFKGHQSVISIKCNKSSAKTETRARGALKRKNAPRPYFKFFL